MQLIRVVGYRKWVMEREVESGKATSLTMNRYLNHNRQGRPGSTSVRQPMQSECRSNLMYTATWTQGMHLAFKCSVQPVTQHQHLHLT
jgi:hypothetical protein